MPEDAIKNKTFGETINELKEKVKSGNFTAEDFEKCQKQKENEEKEYLSLLEWAGQLKNEDKDLEKLLKINGSKRASDILEDIRSLGFAVQKELGDAFEKSGYRLLEQTRAGKRSEAMYGITRIFMSFGKKLPDILHEAFKPYYSEELFKCFIYAFLGAVIPENAKSQSNKDKEKEE